MNIKDIFKKNIFQNEDVFQSSKPASIGAFLLVAIVLTSLLSVRYYLYQNIISNGIAQKTIYAKNTFEVVDKQRTELIKREVANKIRPVVAPVEGDYIKTDLDKAIDDIEKIKKDKKKNYLIRQKELIDLLEVNDSDREEKAVAYILSASDANLTSTFTNTKYILNELLTVGIFDSDISNFITDSFMDKTLGTHVKKSQYPLILALIEHSVIPNLIIDEYATDVARKNAKNAVKPYVVTIKKGDTIIKAGEKVTQLKKDALKISGYNAFELNKGGIFGIFALVCVTMYSLILYIRKYEKKFYTPRYMLYIALSAIILTYTCILISNSAHISNYLMPFIAFTLILAIFTNSILSFLVSILMLAILSVTLFFDSQLIYVFTIATLSGSYLVSKMSYSKRFDIIWCGFQVGIVMFFAMFFVSFFEIQTGAFSKLLQMQVQNPFSGLLNGIVSSMIAMFLIPIIEKICKIVSPYALIELADQNQELLAKMRNSAPGTFHHSLIVSNLCEAAANAIGADSILARVGALYHDIGKLQRPLFFIENQSYFGVENPHTTLTPRQSKMVITLHTKDGVEIARKYGLPQVIIDFIQQHHGESLAGHFYNKAIEQEGEENVSEGQFRYPGPKPRTKETAILMLADALESAVRALKKPTQEEIEALVNKIFTERLNDGQLSDSPLTLKDIKIIAMTFNQILRGMQHERIKYQERVINEIQDKTKITIQNPQDDEFERKIRELQSKSSKNENNENEG
ncbi:MAG: HDIG domain-containing protein [Candidatus Gastranaerophilales bacterium]|nr:HDIG domain-containing protein [Candidatus Gastranaerophilales bacterium]